KGASRVQIPPSPFRAREPAPSGLPAPPFAIDLRAAHTVEVAGTNHSPSDAQLVARCRRGDQESWNVLVERFSRYVYAICVQGFRPPAHDAEDAFQDVFPKVYEGLERLRQDDSLRPWIAQLTRRTCIDRLRVSSREAPVDELEPAGVDDL